ncbi:MAG: DUF4886 domain-containing protein [Lentisphaeria bacterium]|jgi:lysophospholipase L1-like esterase|nr:DUF4886 domain-containing protein [Lentisphaeria bacterium]
MNCFRGIAILISLLAAVAGSQPVSELKVLAIGNSFSGNAFRYLQNIIDAHGKVKATLGHASIGGCSLERHWQEHLKSQQNPEHKPYSYQGRKLNLQDYLAAEKWDVVTVQQNSPNSFKPETFQPWADHLAGLIRQHAPQARIHIHRTWAYRPDHRFFRAGADFTPEDMHRQSGEAYRRLAKHLQAPLIPAGDAMWLAFHTQTAKAVLPDPDFNYEKPTHPQLPKDDGALITGYSWRKNAKTGVPELKFDGIHANTRGCYLIGCVWYAFLFQQDLADLQYAPAGITPEDARFLRDMARKTVLDNR